MPQTKQFYCDSLDVESLEKVLGRCMPEKRDAFDDMIDRMTDAGCSTEYKFISLLQGALDYVKHGN